MQVEVRERQPGTFPVGALFMLPLFALPLGAWLVQTGWLVFGVCGLKATLGFPCLTCGATRATIHLLHGNAFDALSTQPLIIFIYLVFALWGTVSLASFAMDRSVQLNLSDWENTALKLSIAFLPLLNWAYLIAAGV